MDWMLADGKTSLLLSVGVTILWSREKVSSSPEVV